MTWHHARRDIECQLSEGILTVKLNRAARMNAFTVTMADELIEAFESASEDDQVRAIILTGEGKAFCAGMDLEGEGQANVFGLNEALQPTLKDLNDRLDDPGIVKGVRDTGGRVVLAMFECKKPIVAAINGVAVGVGATLTLPCDVRLGLNPIAFWFCIRQDRHRTGCLCQLVLAARGGHAQGA
jgi:enoyl-CoA hydratase/carnithine racemase